jgi:hypothetical protein
MGGSRSHTCPRKRKEIFAGKVCQCGGGSIKQRTFQIFAGNRKLISISLHRSRPGPDMPYSCMELIGK